MQPREGRSSEEGGCEPVGVGVAGMRVPLEKGMGSLVDEDDRGEEKKC